ncbi:hypothetical protein [Nonomuraea diastatica]|uniref:Uncharacterized protein n=1 Tax=Nonomuraea diastatica TaxID=1848329 RepID=A0A4R4WYR4_9ACTN|nr:hypothetical protein [Nonomuraea diastatica]TDD22994.1 hypothetical protein E1294_10230 [Nonomuraea diastatica]
MLAERPHRLVCVDDDRLGTTFAPAFAAAGYELLAEVAEAELVFLVADAADWPEDFYGRLGFEPLGSAHAFLRV